jgi:hypothetical protein
MRRAHWLIAALLCLLAPASAQEPEWKVIACTVENPERQRGTGITIYFAESGQVRFGGKQHPATVTRAEIQFCSASADTAINTKVCYSISRISGRFNGSSIGSVGGVLIFNGSCVPEGQQPKF